MEPGGGGKLCVTAAGGVVACFGEVVAFDPGLDVAARLFEDVLVPERDVALGFRFVAEEEVFGRFVLVAIAINPFRGWGRRWQRQMNLLR